MTKIGAVENLRVTSVAALNGDIVIAGAIKNEKLSGRVYVLPDRLLYECTMVRALRAEKDRILFGAINDDEQPTTDIVETRPPFQKTKVIATVPAFVHAIERRDHVYVLLTRHGDASVSVPKSSFKKKKKTYIYY